MFNFNHFQLVYRSSLRALLWGSAALVRCATYAMAEFNSFQHQNDPTVHNLCILKQREGERQRERERGKKIERERGRERERVRLDRVFGDHRWLRVLKRNAGHCSLGPTKVHKILRDYLVNPLLGRIWP